jgi:hypothetical protein
MDWYEETSKKLEAIVKENQTLKTLLVAAWLREEALRG